MRLIDRQPAAAVPSRCVGSSGRPQPAASSTAPNDSPEYIHDTGDIHLMNRPRRRFEVMRRRRSTHVLLVVELTALALVLTTSSAHADTVVLAIADSVTTVLDNIRNWIMGILAGLATVFLTIGGVRYVMGGHDPGEVEKAKIAFKSAGWGFALAALAPLVVEILKGIVGVQ